MISMFGSSLMTRRIFIFCALALATFAMRDATVVLAQSTLEVPPPSQQSQPNMPAPAPPRPMYVPNPSGEGETIQLLPPQLFLPPPPPPRAVPQPTYAAPPALPVAPLTAQSTPVLPEVFRGCWQGEVSNLDWIRREPGAHKVGFWTPKTYRLCYKRVGTGPFKLTFTETGVAPSEKIINPHGQVVPITTDGRGFATMRARLHFDEYGAGRNPSASTFAVDETTNLNCRINGQQMMVSADVYGTRDGAPWFRARWRAEFIHFPD